MSAVIVASPGALVQQRHLAEVVAQAEAAALVSADGHGRLAVLDHEEPDAGLALGRHRVAGIERPLLHGRGDPLQLLPVQVGEIGTRFEEIGGALWHVRTMPH